MMRKIELLLFFMILACTALDAQVPVAVPGDNGLYGYVDPSTHGWVVQPQFVKAWNFSEDRAMVFDGEKYGFLDRSFNLVVPYIYDDAYRYSNGMATVCRNGRWGAINMAGKLEVPFKYAWMGTFNDGLCLVSTEKPVDGMYGSFGWVNSMGREVIAPQYLNTNWSGGPVAFVMNGTGQYEIIDIRGEESLAGLLSYAYTPWNGIRTCSRFSVMKDGKCGFVDASGTLVVPFIYDDVIEFVDGRAAVRRDGSWGIIDEAGTEILPCGYSSVQSYRYGFAEVRDGDMYGLVDRSGSFAVPCEYEEINTLARGLYALKKSGYWTVFRADGAAVDFERYSEVSGIDSERFHACRDGRWGVVGSDGTVLVDFKKPSKVIVDTVDDMPQTSAAGMPVFFVKFLQSYSGDAPADEVFIARAASSVNLDLEIGSFDEVSWGIPVWADDFGRGFIQIDRQAGESFLEKWYRTQLTATPEYCIHNEKFALRKVVFEDRDGGRWTATFIPDDVTW